MVLPESVAVFPSPVRGSPGSLALCLLLAAARKKAKIYSALKVLINMQTIRPEILLILVTGLVFALLPEDVYNTNVELSSLQEI